LHTIVLNENWFCLLIITKNVDFIHINGVDFISGL